MALNWLKRESGPLRRVLLYSLPQAVNAQLSSEKHHLLFWLASTSNSEHVAKAKCWLLRGLVYIPSSTTKSYFLTWREYLTPAFTNFSSFTKLDWYHLTGLI